MLCVMVLLVSMRAHAQNITDFVGLAQVTEVDQATPIAQSPPSRPSPYVVDGLALGGHVYFESAAYKQYQCLPSEYVGYTWCHKQKQEHTDRGEITSSNSIMHNQDGTALYVNRHIEPTFLGSNDVRSEIDRLSAKFGERARELRMPLREGLPNAIIAVWGKIKLEQLDAADVSILSAGGRLHKGILVSFLGDLQQSAKLGVPVYRLAGGAGFLWSASFNQDGRGVLRFLTIDASTINAQPQTSTGVQPPNTAAHQKPSAAESNTRPSQNDITKSKEDDQSTYKNISAATLKSSQSLRDTLFNNLKVSSTHYTFDYLVINLPPGTIPGINVSVPVSHIRYSDTVFFAFDSYSLEQAAQPVVMDFANTITKD